MACVIISHMPPRTRPPLDRFVEKFRQDPATGCWIWTAYVDPVVGYGTFLMPRGTTRAHRAAYELFIGAIPAGLTIDHLCRNKVCVNPAHLEAVTQRVNTNRGPGGRQFACVNGHLMTGDNTGGRRDGQRYCKTCHRDKARVKRAEERAARLREP